MAYSKLLICFSLSFLFLILLLLLFISFYFSVAFLSPFSWEVPVGRWRLWNARRPGYCKHQHSSILYSSSSKGKLLALIEWETNLSSLSLSLLFLLGAVISLTILEGQEAFERSLRNDTLEEEVGLFRSQIHATILLSLQISV